MITWLRDLVRETGYDIVRFPYRTIYAGDLHDLLSRLQIDVVFDIGANVGQFARELRAKNYDGTIVSFEPLVEAHEILSSAAQIDPGWFVHPRIALGSQQVGQGEIYVSKNSVSSSFLEMLPAHTSAAKGSEPTGVNIVDITTLDDIAGPYINSGSAIFIKIDTQGYEAEVISGATRTLSRAAGVMCELSLVPLYKNQPLWKDVVETLANSGFHLWSLKPGFSDPNTGRLLQMDGIFVHKSRL
jgi:FkbM family methyltransferase